MTIPATRKCPPQPWLLGRLPSSISRLFNRLPKRQVPTTASNGHSWPWWSLPAVPLEWKSPPVPTPPKDTCGCATRAKTPSSIASRRLARPHQRHGSARPVAGILHESAARHGGTKAVGNARGATLVKKSPAAGHCRCFRHRRSAQTSAVRGSPRRHPFTQRAKASAEKACGFQSPKAGQEKEEQAIVKERSPPYPGRTPGSGNC